MGVRHGGPRVAGALLHSGGGGGVKGGRLQAAEALQDGVGVRHGGPRFTGALYTLFNALVAAAASKVGDFKPQKLANTSWAFAKAGHASPALFDALAAAAASKVGDFKPHELANTAWAFATAGHLRVAGALLRADAGAAGGIACRRFQDAL